MLDGFVHAAASLKNTTGSIQGDFERNMTALAAAYGVTPADSVDQLVDDVIAAIRADVTANTSAT